MRSLGPLVLLAACGAPGSATPDADLASDARTTINDAPGADASSPDAPSTDGGVDAMSSDAMVNVDAAGCTPGAWTIETIDAAGDVGSVHDLASDSSGRLHVAYWDKTNGDLKYALRTADGTWTTMLVDATNNVGGSVSIVTDAAGNPHIAYLDQTTSDLKYATRTGTGAWSTVIVDSEGNAGLFPAIAIDTTGTLHVSYRGVNDVGSEATVYAYKPWGGAWTSAFGAGGASAPSAITTVGTTVHVAVALTTEVAVLSRSSPAAAWNFDNNVNTPRAERFSLAFDANRGTHLVYHVFSMPQLGYAYKPAAGSWALTTMDTMDQTGGNNDLVVDAAGGLHVGYTARRFGSDFDLRYAYKAANGSWTTQTITVANDVHDRMSLALTPAGPHLTYYTENARDLMHAYRCE